MRACEHGAHASCTRGFVRHVLSLSESQSELLFEKDPSPNGNDASTGDGARSSLHTVAERKNTESENRQNDTLLTRRPQSKEGVRRWIWALIGLWGGDGDSGRLGVGEEWGWGGETGEEGGDLGGGDPSRALTGPITLNPPCAQENVTVNHAAKAQPAHSMMSSLTRTRTCEHQPRAGVRRGPGHSHLCTRRGCPASSG